MSQNWDERFTVFSQAEEGDEDERGNETDEREGDDRRIKKKARGRWEDKASVVVK